MSWKRRNVLVRTATEAWGVVQLIYDYVFDESPHLRFQHKKRYEHAETHEWAQCGRGRVTVLFSTTLNLSNSHRSLFTRLKSFYSFFGGLMVVKEKTCSRCLVWFSLLKGFLLKCPSENLLFFYFENLLLSCRTFQNRCLYLKIFLNRGFGLLKLKSGWTCCSFLQTRLLPFVCFKSV